MFKKHPSQPYNPDIANAFFRAGLIESWGRGVDVMVQACLKYDSPAPVLRYEDSGFWVEFSGRELEKTTQKTTQKILSILQDNPSASRKEIAEVLGDITEDGVKYQLAKMKKEKLIERVGADKGGYWNILNKSL